MSLITENRTVILYESPHRLLKLLQEINDLFESNRKIAVTREISKIYEETKIGSAGELLEYYKNNKPKGEIVVVLSKQDKKSQKIT